MTRQALLHCAFGGKKYQTISGPLRSGKVLEWDKMETIEERGNLLEVLLFRRRGGEKALPGSTSVYENRGRSPVLGASTLENKSCKIDAWFLTENILFLWTFPHYVFSTQMCACSTHGGGGGGYAISGSDLANISQVCITQEYVQTYLRNKPFPMQAFLKVI